MDMQPTSEEHREVVERLRSEEIARNVKEAYVVLLSCIGIRTQLPAVRTYKDAMVRMADLIDPTTHIGVNKHGRVYCTNCGCDDWCLADGSHFCPNCGARAVRDDDTYGD